MRDVQWAGWTATIGWPVLGLWARNPAHSHPVAVDRAPSASWVALVDGSGALCVRPYPCLDDPSVLSPTPGLVAGEVFPSLVAPAATAAPPAAAGGAGALRAAAAARAVPGRGALAAVRQKAAAAAAGGLVAESVAAPSHRGPPAPSSASAGVLPQPGPAGCLQHALPGVSVRVNCDGTRVWSTSGGELFQWAVTA
jgi:hypothetical protein